jgi:uncharacterized protein
MISVAKVKDCSIYKRGSEKMAKSTRQYVFEGMELLPKALIPFVEKRLESSLTGHWQLQVLERYKGLHATKNGGVEWDQQSLLKVMNIFWMDAFKNVLGPAERSLVNELISVRNELAHDGKFNYDDAERALDSMRRLLDAISSGETADQISKMRNTILRTKFSELARNEERKKTQRMDISVETMPGLLPWREVMEPHQDVATGEFQQAEFAADLGKVHNGSAPPEYSNPNDFFSRTYLTEGLSTLLKGAAKRLSNAGGDPVIELQTNFGGGKTHSMLALYHMAGKVPTSDLSGLDQLLSRENLTVPSTINRAVLVGTSRGPQDVLKTDDGRKIRTTWGELAWQLGGASVFDMISENDEKGIAPGSNLLETIFNKCSPCLILIDEWVAYLRQIYKVDSLPSGSFDANLSFVQSLTEAVKASPGTLLVASLPASQIEVGGEGGQEALSRLKQTFSRVESSWRPASQEESYEIVRRRLFKETPSDIFHHKDNTLKQFAKLYRENSNDFPLGCADEDYRRKLEKAYPIHPELFDQLYTGWGSLEKFQKTRGVLRLMAQVVHELWMNNDPSIMIMPGNVSISSPRVEPELLHYLESHWQGIIAGDIDGSGSTPFKIDQSAPNLNRYSATRRVARAIFMGSAPTHKQLNKGLDDKQINLGVVQPGERPAIFGDALRRLTNQAKFMHSEMGRYWYSLSASLNRVAADRAAQLEEAFVLMEVDKELTKYISSLSDHGNFDAVQVAPGTSADVPDDVGGVRAVIFGVAHPHNGRDKSEAMTEVKEILMQRGSTARVYRNTLVFIAPDVRQLSDLKDAVRTSIAWKEIIRDTKRLDLKTSDISMAEEKLSHTIETVKTRLREAWSYLLYPVQETAQSDVEWISGKIPAQDGVLSRASKKLLSDEGLMSELGPARLERDLQRYIWHEKPHVSLKDLWEYLNRYTYLPRLKNQLVLVKTIQTAVSGLLPGPFAYAVNWDDGKQIYQGLIIDQSGNAPIIIDSDSVIIRQEIAESYRQKNEDPINIGDDSTSNTEPEDSDETVPILEPQHQPTRFFGTVMISPERPARDIHQIVEGIIEQLTTMPNAEVSINLEIDAEIPSGLDRNKVRTLMENATTLGFIEKLIK